MENVQQVANAEKPTAIGPGRHPFAKNFTGTNDWVRYIASIHFDPKWGAPFWLERAKELQMDPLRDIRSYEDLMAFGMMDREQLCRRNVRDFLPAKIAAEPSKLRIYETGGTTGAPARVAYRDYFSKQAEWMAWYYDKVLGFPQGVDWLWIGPPGGCHAAGDFYAELARRGGGACYFVDLDPRYVKTMVREGDAKGVARYVAHILEQALHVLDTQDIGVLATTPALLQQFGPQLAERKTFRGLSYAGTTLTPDLYRLLLTEFFPDTVQNAIYGNTLMGTAPQRPAQPDDFNVVYYPMEPYFKVDLVDLATNQKVVGYGETGQVRLTQMSEELLLVNMLERDQAERWRPLDGVMEFDGVANVRPIAAPGKTITEGVY